MKQGTNFILPVEIDIDLDKVEQIEFVFKQKSVEHTFTYPSDIAVREGNTINLIWTQADTYKFIADKVEMDTRITLINSPYNPETPIVVFHMDRTLFKEVMADD